MGVDDLRITKGDFKESISTEPGEWKTKPDKTYDCQSHYGSTDPPGPCATPIDDKDKEFIIPDGHVLLYCL